jgi:hypothetical protein
MGFPTIYTQVNSLSADLSNTRLDDSAAEAQRPKGSRGKKGDQLLYLYPTAPTFTGVTPDTGVSRSCVPQD